MANTIKPLGWLLRNALHITLAFASRVGLLLNPAFDIVVLNRINTNRNPASAFGGGAGNELLRLGLFSYLLEFAMIQSLLVDYLLGSTISCSASGFIVKGVWYAGEIVIIIVDSLLFEMLRLSPRFGKPLMAGIQGGDDFQHIVFI